MKIDHACATLEYIYIRINNDAFQDTPKNKIGEKSQS